MKKLYYGLFPILLVLSFFLGRQTQQFFRRVQTKPVIALEKVYLEEISVENLKTEKGTSQLTALFNEPYTNSNSSIYEKEIKIMRRLRVLQRIAAENSAAPHPNWLPIFKTILQNTQEAWVVQRQALKNLQPYWSQFSEKERDQLLAQIDLRAKTTWHLPDKEFVQMFENIP